MTVKKRKKTLSFIDLFAGAGGLSEGFIRAGFKPVAHIEMDKDCCSTLKTRIAYRHLREIRKLSEYVKYLKGEISRDELYGQVPKDLFDTVLNEEINDANINAIFNKVRENKKRLKINKIDLIIGGPPCQVYSNIGRSVIGDNRIKRDKRYYLYQNYGDFIKEFKPRFFVFENVPGILTADKGKLFVDIQEYLTECGYTMKWKMLDASKFGVLQKRKRIIMFGYPIGKHFEYPEFEEIKMNFKISDILYDLPSLKAGESRKWTEYVKEANEYLYQAEIRNGLEVLPQHITRTHNDNDLKIYEKTISTWNIKKVRLKYTDLPKKMQTHKNDKSFLDRFKVVDQNGYSHTMLAHIAKDGHYYIHPDINQVRSISIREAARIQSFPDDYYFEGSRTATFKQIGNAVPLLMAQVIAKEIKKKINSI